MEGQDAASAPDLHRILATLSQYSNPLGDPASRLPAQNVAQEQPSGVLSELQSAESHHVPQDPRLRPQSRSATASPKPMIDPATITTWQEGLRCVTKIAAQNAHFATAIKRMMNDQRKHEMQWYKDRLALKQLQVSRSKTSSEVQSILSGLGGDAIGEPPKQTEEEKLAELAAFDFKIYQAQAQMEQVMTAELKGLGVPFFGTKRDLILADDHASAALGPPETQPKWSPRVTEADLLGLRRRMVQHLEDLYRD